MGVIIEELLNQMIIENASDLHLTVGVPPILRVNGELHRRGEDILLSNDIDELAKTILSSKDYEVFCKTKEFDLCISRARIGRFRVNLFKQRGSTAIAIRNVNAEISTIAKLGLPETIEEIASKTRGLFLVTGPTGSGKSTTIAALIDLINRERKAHIITLEDPIEYLHKHKMSIVNQREIGEDTDSFAGALRAALREDPDVIFIGEMRDLETIQTALVAAETGHLVLSTLHTIGAAQTIDRVTDVFPPHQQQQIRLQLSSVLIGVLSQVLIPTCNKSGRVLVHELMLASPAIRNLIRESKTYQISSIMQTSTKAGMTTLDKQLLDLVERGIISAENAVIYAEDPEFVIKSIHMF